MNWFKRFFPKADKKSTQADDQHPITASAIAATTTPSETEPSPVPNTRAASGPAEHNAAKGGEPESFPAEEQEDVSLPDVETNQPSASLEPSAAARSTTEDYRQYRQIRVFISSTFRDMQEERDRLVKFTFPELRRRCRERQVEFLEVDLRWGVTEEQAERGEVLPICLAEIENCRPFFIGFLGERYGHVPENVHHEIVKAYPWLAEHGERSLTEIEIRHGVLRNSDIAPRAFFYFRDPAYLDRVPAARRSDFVSESPDAAAKLDTLKQSIRESGLHLHENYPSPEALGDLILEDLWQVIDEEFPANSASDALDRETAEHDAFAEARRAIYIGRQAYYEALDQHVLGDGPPLVILGESGSGKSALLANWVKRYHKDHSGDFVLLHFIGSSHYSADYVAILKRIFNEIVRQFGVTQEVPNTPERLREEFPSWLAKASAKLSTVAHTSRFILVLDGLNQLEDKEAALHLGWLPKELPPKIRLIVSTLVGPSLDALARRGWPTLHVHPLCAEERAHLVQNYFARYRKTLEGSRMQRITSSGQAANPLFLQTLVEELRVLGGYEELDRRIDGYLAAATLDDLYNMILARYERDYERDCPGVVSEAMSLLWAARQGLSQSEILELLGSNGQMIPASLWSPFYLAAEKMFVVNSGFLVFGHDHVRRAVWDRYFTTEEWGRAIHARLADYFLHRADPAGNHSWKGGTLRGFAELPYHLAHAGEGSTLAETLMDARFLDAKVRALGPYSLIGDLDLAQRTSQISPDSRVALSLIERALRLAAHVLMEDPGQLPAQLLGRLQTTDSPLIRSFLEVVRQLPSTAWMRPITAGLAQANNSLVATLAGHDGCVSSVATLRDGRRILTASSDGLVMVWDMDTGGIVHRLSGHEGEVTSVVPLADGWRAVSGSHDKTLRVWDVEAGRAVRVLRGHEDRVIALVEYPEKGRVLSASADGTIRLWDIETGRVIKTLVGFAGWVLAVDPDGRKALAGGADGELTVWDLDSATPLRQLQGPLRPQRSAVVLSDGWRAVSGGGWLADTEAAADLTVWDLNTGQVLRSLRTGVRGVKALAALPDGRSVLVGGGDATAGSKYELELWDIEAGRRMGRLVGHAREVESIAVTRDGNRAVSGSWDRTAKVWDIRSAETASPDEAHLPDLKFLTVDAIRMRGVTTSLDGNVQVWDLASGRVLHTLETAHEEITKPPVFLRNGDWLMASVQHERSRDEDMEGFLRLLTPAWQGQAPDTQALATPWEQICAPGSIRFVRLLGFLGVLANAWRGQAADAQLLSTSWVKIWDVESGRLVRLLPGRWLCEGHNGQVIITASEEHSLKVWDAISGREIARCVGHTASINTAIILHDGKRIASASDDRTVRIWDLSSGKELGIFSGHGAPVKSIAHLVNTRLLVSSSNKYEYFDEQLPSGKELTAEEIARLRSTLRVWDLEIGACVREIEIDPIDDRWHLHAIASGDLVAVTSRSPATTQWPDGRIVHPGEKLEVWQTSTGSRVMVVSGKLASVLPGGRVGASSETGRSVKLWDLSTGTPFALFSGHRDAVRAVFHLRDDLWLTLAGKMLTVWTPCQYVPLASFGTDGDLRLCAVAPDGISILAAEESGVVHLVRFEDPTEPRPPESATQRKAERSDKTLGHKSKTLFAPEDSVVVEEVQAILARGRDLIENAHFHEAESLIDEAEKAFRKVGSNLHLAAVNLSRGQMLKQQGQLDQALECYATVAREARCVGATDLLANCLVQQATIMQQLRDFDGAVTWYEEAIHLLRELGDTVVLPQCLINQAIVLEAKGDLDWASALFEEAEPLARAANVSLLKTCLAHRLSLVWVRSTNDPGMVAALCSQVEAMCRDATDKDLLVQAVIAHAMALCALGEKNGALEVVRKSELIARKWGDPGTLSALIQCRSGLLFENEGPRSSLEALQEAEPLLSELSDRSQLATSLWVRALFHRALRESDAALSLYAKQDELCRTHGLDMCLAMAQADHASLLDEQGAPERALALCQEAELVARHQGAKSLLGKLLLIQIEVLKQKGEAERVRSLECEWEKINLESIMKEKAKEVKVVKLQVSLEELYNRVSGGGLPVALQDSEGVDEEFDANGLASEAEVIQTIDYPTPSPPYFRDMRNHGRHDKQIEAVVAVPGGEMVISASQDNTARVWDLQTGEETRMLQGHTAWVTSVAVFKDGRRAVTGSSDGQLKMWDLQSGACLGTAVTEGSIMKMCPMSDNRSALVGYISGSLALWDLELLKQHCTYAMHDEPVRAIAITPDDRIVVSAAGNHLYGGQQEPKVWELHTGRVIRVLVGHTASVWVLSMLPDGGHAVSGSPDSTVRVWNLESGKLERTIAEGSDPVYALASFPGGHHLAFGSGTTLIVWDMQSATALARFNAQDSITSCAVAGDGHTIIAGGHSGKLYFLRLERADGCKDEWLIRDLFAGDTCRLSAGPREVADALCRRSEQQMKAGNLDAAIAGFTEAIRQDPKHVASYLGRGKAKKASGDLSGALLDLRKAQELSRDNPGEVTR